MPKRSNAFQEAIYLVQNHLAGDAMVTESKELPDVVTGTLREVDVCVESEVAGHHVTVSIECRDHTRAQTVGWIEEMHTKHQRLPTNLLVLVSSSGFTPEALRVAELYGIVGVAPGDLATDFGRHFQEQFDKLWIKTLTASPKRVRLWVEETEELPEEIVRAFPDNLVYLVDGTELSTVRELAVKVLNRAVEGNIDDLLRDATGTETHISAERDLNEVRTPGRRKSPSLYLRKIDPAGDVLRRITRIHIIGDAQVGVGEVPLTHGELQGTAFAFGESRLDDSDILLVLTSDETGAGRITLRKKGQDPAQ